MLRCRRLAPSPVTRIEEFNGHVWDHTKDAFQIRFDQPPPIGLAIKKRLAALASKMASETDDGVIAKEVQQDFEELGNRYLEVLLQISGLTRSKIITDLRVIGSGRRIPGSYDRLPSSSAWDIAGPYLVQRSRRVLPNVRREQFNELLDALNNATWPGWIRQERAKRQGHEAERRAAQVLKALGYPFQPEDKAENPLSGDVQIYGVSFDLVIPSLRSPRMCLKSTVHTSNIGQYGESKDHLEVAEAKTMLNQHFKQEGRPILLALVDGIGFRSNRAGLEGVLEKSDEFFQFRTLWKVIVVAESLLRLQPELKMYLPERERIQYASFLSKWGWNGKRLLTVVPTRNTYAVGDAVFDVSGLQELGTQTKLTK